jgi:hypothetical protein
MTSTRTVDSIATFFTNRLLAHSLRPKPSRADVPVPGVDEVSTGKIAPANGVKNLPTYGRNVSEFVQLSVVVSQDRSEGSSYDRSNVQYGESTD